jgi:hypothetical protein
MKSSLRSKPVPNNACPLRWIDRESYQSQVSIAELAGKLADDAMGVLMSPDGLCARYAFFSVDGGIVFARADSLPMGDKVADAKTSLDRDGMAAFIRERIGRVPSIK